MKILVVRLQSDSNKNTHMGHDVYEVVEQTENEYCVDLALRNLCINNKKVIPKVETNKIKYIEMFSRIDEKEYWFVDAYVYVTIEDENTDTLMYWKEQLQSTSMAHIKDRNKTLKDFYYSIKSL